MFRAAPLRPLLRLGTSYTKVRLNSSYQKPALGVNPAYDEALKVIDAYRSKLFSQIEDINSKLKNTKTEQEKADLENEKIELEIEADKQLGETLYNFRTGNYDLKKPVYRRLLEEEFKKRPLEVIMQRTYQMYVIPDLIDPKKFKQATTRLDIVIDGSNEGPIEPGTRVDPQAMRKQPKVHLQTFSETPKKYTIVMVDPDEPSEELRSYKQKCHWAVCNATFDIYNNALSESSGAQELVPYVPPHPAYGSKTHRYVYIAFLQDNELTASTIEQLGARLLKSDIKEIEGIDLRKISEEFGLLPVGVSFYRSEWNESVDSVYTDILGQDSPRFGAPLVPNKFLDQYGNKLSRYENI